MKPARRATCHGKNLRGSLDFARAAVTQHRHRSDQRRPGVQYLQPGHRSCRGRAYAPAWDLDDPVVGLVQSVTEPGAVRACSLDRGQHAVEVIAGAAAESVTCPAKTRGIREGALVDQNAVGGGDDGAGVGRRVRVDIDCVPVEVNHGSCNTWHDDVLLHSLGGLRCRRRTGMKKSLRGRLVVSHATGTAVPIAAMLLIKPSRWSVSAPTPSTHRTDPGHDTPRVRRYRSHGGR